MESGKRQRRFAIVILFITVLEFIGTIVNAIIQYPDGLFSNLALAFQCIVMVVLIFLPIYFRKLFSVKMPTIIYVLFTVLCFCGLVLGDVSSYYAKYAHWDDLLHFGSGMLLAAIGFVLVNTLSSSEKSKTHLSPVFISCVAFCFAMTGQALWEIGEFLCDEFLGTNAQTFLETSTGSFVGANDIPLVGHEALRDTMYDFMLDGVGGLIIAVIGYFDIKRGKKNVFAERFEAADPIPAPQEKRKKRDDSPSEKEE